MGILFRIIVGIGSDAVSAFIRQRKSKALYKTLLPMGKQQKFQVNRLEYLEEAVTLYGTYSANNTGEVVDAINHLHNTLDKHEEILCSKQPIGIKVTFWKGVLPVWSLMAYYICMTYK